MAGEHGEGIAYKGLTMHKAKRWNTVTGKVLCAVMWFWVLYRAKQDGPVVLVGLVSLSSFKDFLTFGINSLSWYFFVFCRAGDIRGRAMDTGTRYLMALVREEKHYHGPPLFYANESCVLNLKAAQRKWDDHALISLIAGIPMKSEDEWPSMKVFVDELLVMSSGIALFFVHFSKLLAEKDS
ncbi:hypothetical protein SADUNF_Sadunf02G0010400 [Salix dunnii]|uniref:Uncharacterized protein n=1 Tax=Salix dunnii TaxID=1413687 RepID=A0A835TEU9_9ROSI|nr:hypothetical protein SADUNF_Sadunf02G0010400 [Salix dunnii]